MRFFVPAALAIMAVVPLAPAVPSLGSPRYRVPLLLQYRATPQQRA